MNLAEKDQVISFLKKKNLSYPLYKEILEHFFTDIEIAMNEGACFQEAFLQTKIKWQPEFRMVSADPLSFKKITKIEAGLLGNKFSRITRIAWSAALAAVVLAFIYEPAVMYVAALLWGILVIAVLIMLFSRKLSFFEYIKMSFHPLMIKLSAFCVLLIILAPYLADQIFNGNAETIQAITVIFAAVIQIQLLALHRKKINVLLS